MQHRNRALEAPLMVQIPKDDVIAIVGVRTVLEDNKAAGQ